MDRYAIGLVVLVAPFVVLPIGLASRRLYWTAWVQDRVLRWTGKSRLVATAWGHTISPRRPLAPCRARGVTPAGAAPGNRRTLAGASAPAARPIPGVRAAGSTVCLDVQPTPGAHPNVEADTATLPAWPRQGGHQLTAAAQCPERRAVAVYHPVGAS